MCWLGEIKTMTPLVTSLTFGRSYVDIGLFLSSRVHFAPDNFHDCSLLDRTSLTNHDMHLKQEKSKDVFLWKNNTKGILSKSRPNIIMVIFHGNQFAE